MGLKIALSSGKGDIKILISFLHWSISKKKGIVMTEFVLVYKIFKKNKLIILQFTISYVIT